MADARAFLDAIIANPGDDAPRLIYADWLDEQGDCDRAEFIRVQVELAHLPDNEATFDTPQTCARRIELKQREEELLKRHRRTWDVQLFGRRGPLQARDTEYAYRRGFPDRINLPAERFFPATEKLFRMTPVVQLEVPDLTRDALTQLLQLPALARVERLVLRLAEPGVVPFEPALACPHLSSLRYLWLENGSLSPKSLGELARPTRFPLLRDLGLSGCPISTAGSRQLARALPDTRLESVFLHDCGMEPRGLAALADLDLPAPFRALSMPSHPFGASGARILARGKTLPQLAEMRLWSANLGTEGAEELARTPHGRMKNLHLALNAFHDDAIEVLTNAPLLTGVRRLDLSSNKMTARGAQVLAASPRLKDLVALDLSSNDLGNAGIEALANSPHLVKLVRLDVLANSMTAAGARALVRSPHLANLTALRVSSQGVRGAVLTELRDRFGAGLEVW